MIDALLVVAAVVVTIGIVLGSHNPSNPPKSGRQTNTTQYLEERRAISSKYTIAPAYNKGAYQVISQDNVEDIGR